MLKVCVLYAGERDITFNSDNKIKLMYFTMNNQSPGSIQFMRYKLNVITKCTLLGVEILNIFSADIDHSVKQFNCKYMSVYLDFKYLQCDVLSNMISTYCLYMHHYYGIMRINVLKVLCGMENSLEVTYSDSLQFITCYYQLLPVNIMLEKIILKFIWSIINSENLIVNSVFECA